MVVTTRADSHGLFWVQGVSSLSEIPCATKLLLEKAKEKDADIFTAGPQRREVDGGLGEAMEKGLGESTPGGDLVDGGGIGGGQEPDVDPSGHSAPEPAHLASLEDAQQGRLNLGGREAYLVEEESAAVGFLEVAGPIAGRAGEGAALVAEELGQRQAGWARRRG